MQLYVSCNEVLGEITLTFRESFFEEGDFIHRLYFNKISTFRKLGLLPSSCLTLAWPGGPTSGFLFIFTWRQKKILLSKGCNFVEIYTMDTVQQNTDYASPSWETYRLNWYSGIHLRLVRNFKDYLRQFYCIHITYYFERNVTPLETRWIFCSFVNNLPVIFVYKYKMMFTHCFYTINCTEIMTLFFYCGTLGNTCSFRPELSYTRQ